MQPQIVVAFDFGTAARKALLWAADLQRTLGSKPLEVVYALNPLPGAPVPETVPLPVLSPADISDIAAMLADVVHRISPSAATQIVVSGAAGAAILDAARRLGADLIVTGTHSRGALSRFFVGSVAEYVLRHASVPVVTVREESAPAASAEPPSTPGTGVPVPGFV